MSELKFSNLILEKDGMIKGPFGGDIKKSLFVPKDSTTYKVYEQGVVYNKNMDVGTYYISSDYFNKKLKRFEIKAGDILITGAGTLGDLYEVPSEFEKGIINQALIRIRINEEIIDKQYFKYYFNYFIRKIACRLNGDSVIPNLPPLSVLKDIKVDIPPKQIQKNIASTLSLLDRKIANNSLILSELESIAKTIYDYWFLQFDFPDENGMPYKSSGGKMVWNDEVKCEIPKEWSTSTLAAYCNFRNGINYDKNGQGDTEYNIVNVRDITASNLIVNTNSLDRIRLLKTRGDKYLVQNADILISRSASAGSIRILLDNPSKTIYCGFIIACTPKNPELRNYLLYSLKIYEGSAITNPDGTVFGNVTQDTLASLKIVIPDTKVIQIFNQLVNPLFDLMRKCIHENNELTNLRDFLLPMLMNGQVNFTE